MTIDDALKLLQDAANTPGPVQDALNDIGDCLPELVVRNPKQIIAAAQLVNHAQKVRTASEKYATAVVKSK